MSGNELYCGIDPGKQGGIAFIDKTGFPVNWHDMPAADKYLDGFALHKIVSGSFIPVQGWIEKVHAMPKQGVSSTFSFGVNFGMALQAMASAGMPHELVTPQRWHKVMAIKPKATKAEIVAIAQRLWPDAELTTPRGRLLDGRAEALLIAEACRRTYLGTEA